MTTKRNGSSFAIQQIRMQRKNLIHVCRFAVKSLVDLSCSDGLQEKCPELENFCSIIEQILTFRLRPYMTWLGKDEPRFFWDYLRHACKHMNNTCLSSIQHLEIPRTAQGKGRAWIRMALMEKKLSDYMTAALQQTKITRQFYQEGAVMTTEDPNMLAGMLLGLNAIDFSFDIKGEKLDYPGMSVIDFTPYLKFEQRPETERLDGTSEGTDSQVEGDHSDEWKKRRRRLEEKYKVVSEQKGYLDELVRLRESQLMEIQIQRQKLVDTLQHYESESKRERQQLEGIIIELQAQITQTKEDHRIQIQKLQTLIRHYMSDPPAIALTELPPRADPVGNESTEEEGPPSPSDQGPSSMTFPKRKPAPMRPADSHSVVSDTRSNRSAASLASSNAREDNQSMIAMAGSFTSETSTRSAEPTHDPHRSRPPRPRMGSGGDVPVREDQEDGNHCGKDGGNVKGHGRDEESGVEDDKDAGGLKGREGVLEPMSESPEYEEAVGNKGAVSVEEKALEARDTDEDFECNEVSQRVSVEKESKDETEGKVEDQETAECDRDTGAVEASAKQIEDVKSDEPNENDERKGEDEDVEDEPDRVKFIVGSMQS